MTLPKTPSFRLDGKRAFVPGGARGIGLACAAALAEAGAAVTMAARSADQVAQAAKALGGQGVVLDVTDNAAVEAFFAAAAPFDILCNSAGLARHAPALATTPADFDAVMDVNVRAAFFLAQQAARGMVGRGGSILQISSQMGHVGGQDRAVYCATKHAVEGMTKTMAIEWGPERIRVNTICPTFIRTPLTAATFADPEKRAWIESKIKLPRVAEVEDIMGAVVFLASDASAMVTGTALLVDGGWTAG
jgi:2-deoxy-D-gluconate 3-dehydrogenase